MIATIAHYCLLQQQGQQHHCWNNNDGSQTGITQSYKEDSFLGYTKDVISAEKLLNLTTPDATSRHVSQTQNTELPTSPLYIVGSPLSVFPLPRPVTCSSCLHCTVGSPLADNDAILDIVLGLPLCQLDFNEIDPNNQTATEVITHKTAQMTTMSVWTVTISNLNLIDNFMKSWLRQTVLRMKQVIALYLAKTQML